MTRVSVPIGKALEAKLRTAEGMALLRLARITEGATVMLEAGKAVVRGDATGVRRVAAELKALEAATGEVKIRSP